MAWFWRPEGAVPLEGGDDLGLREPFESQSAAEAWLTATYADLADLGVAAVSLYEEDRLVYGPMSLDVE